MIISLVSPFLSGLLAFMIYRYKINQMKYPKTEVVSLVIIIDSFQIISAFYQSLIFIIWACIEFPGNSELLTH
jgi:hypothetical protein